MLSPLWTPSRYMRVSARCLAAMTATVLCSSALHAQQVTSPTAGTTYDITIPPGANFDKAAFRLWTPTGVDSIVGVLVLTPGSNGDGRSAVQDTVWQAFAVKHGLALLASQLTDKAHDQGFIEHYVDVSKGSGQAMLDALSALGVQAKHPELANAPLLLWGMSAGGQFNYEFVAWKPERVVAFVVNKGGIYYSALLPLAARQVPAMLFIGGKDLAFRTNTIVGLFAVNRRAGAVWALANEPSAGHIVGKSRDVSLIFFEDVLNLRRDRTSTALHTLEARDGFIGDLTQQTFARSDGTSPSVPTAWLPTERVARAWRAMESEQTVEVWNQSPER